MNKKAENTIQESELKQRRLKENMLLKELLASTQPISANSSEESKYKAVFVVPEEYRESVEYYKKEYFPEASEQDLVDMLKQYGER